MSQLLPIGSTLHLPTLSRDCVIESFIGGGGEGEVYRARDGSTAMAVKWYYEFRATPQQRKVLQRLVDQGPPNSSFLWPLSLAESVDGSLPGFGYVMPLREPRHKSLRDLMVGAIDPTFKVLATTGLGLASAFRMLHSKGCTYCDISFGNAFFDPATGEVLICDNDNVCIHGEHVAMLGTPDFMAPEIVRQEGLPRIETDLFSLAVLLFYLFHIHHPFMGARMRSFRCWDLPARKRLFGENPTFIFHPSDPSNRACDAAEDPSRECGANALDYWRLYPKFLRDLFTQSFVDGLDPARRVRESQWQQAMARLRDLIYPCAKCGGENFHDPAAAGASRTCWSPACKAPLRPPCRLELPTGTVALNADTRLHPHHLAANRDYDFSEVLAAVARHPNDPTIWGLRNTGTAGWRATRPNGGQVEVPVGKALTLEPNLHVNFGATQGVVHFG